MCIKGYIGELRVSAVADVFTKKIISSRIQFNNLKIL